MLQGNFSFNSQIIAQIFILNFTTEKNWYIIVAFETDINNCIIQYFGGKIKCFKEK